MATEALFDAINDVAVDENLNCYITSYSGIRKIDYDTKEVTLLGIIDFQL
jgi:hypothetical protein